VLGFASILDIVLLTVV